MVKVEAFFKDIIKSKIYQNAKGIVSVCSSNPFVLRAFFKRFSKRDEMLLIESTSNQVNQHGGYTGMKPSNFRDFVFSLAGEYNIDESRIILGGDHLGPNPFAELKANKAMEESCDLIRECVKAGYRKIHLDASMPLKGDVLSYNGGIDPELAAERAAILCKVSEDTIDHIRQGRENFEEPVYVIGTEVPVPGGSDEVEKSVEVTKINNLKTTIELTKRAFLKKGLDIAWERVIAVVCQPGVEFGNSHILEYDRNKAKELTNYLKSINYLVGEAHSTDYQTRRHLRELVEDGFAILKVGPALTFALREAIFALSFIEDELISEKNDRSSLISVLEKAMIENPKWWKSHYSIDSSISFRYSLFDRVRYYWGEKRVSDAVQKLFSNLQNIDIPLSLLSQFLPIQYSKIRNKKLKPKLMDLVLDKIDDVIQDYIYATVGNVDDVDNIY